jgi:hemerythrin
MALQWTSVLATGVRRLDDEHRELFRRVDRLMDGMLRGDRSEAESLLAFLREYVPGHFEAEERLMEERGFPDAARHAEEHRRFGAALRRLDDTLRRGGPTAALVLDLERLVVSWMEQHVYEADAAMARWAAAHREAPRDRTVAIPA